MVESGAVTNVQVFGDEVEVDITINNPSLQAKKKTEVSILQTIHEKVYEKAKIKVNLKVVAPEQEKPQIKGKPIAGIKNIIAVASGKGGVGKSTVSLNLALALSQTGAKVGLLDADIYGPSIPLMLGMKDGYMEVEDNKLQPAESNGIKVVSFGFFAEQAHQAAIYRGPIISGILKQFLVDTNWSDLDYLIVDLPPGTGDIPLTLAQTIPITGILVVTTPQDVASNVAVKAIGMFEKLNVPIIGVVENMSHFICPNCSDKHYIFGDGGAKKISEQFNIPFLGEIPLNAGIMSGSDLGKPIMITSPDSPSADAFKTAAKNIAGQCSIIASRLQEEMAAESQTEESAPEASPQN